MSENGTTMSSQPQVLPGHAPDSGSRPQLSFAVPRRGKPPRHLADLTLPERAEVLAELGQPGYRAKQLSTHYFARLTRDPEQMTDIPAAAREQMAGLLLPDLLREHRRLTADDGATIKTLWSLFDDVKVESVLMAYPGRATLCVSSQAGCGMACPFCATGQQGLTRNLSTAEITEQVRYAALACRDGELTGGPTRLSNIVFMGMGEPLANYRVVVNAVRRMTAPTPAGFGMSARNVTVSTVGLVPAIDKLSNEGLAVTLALSLHAPDDELRDELIPINSRWKVGEALDAAHRYFQRTGRRVSIEYALIRDMNDQAWRAQPLAAELLARGRRRVRFTRIPA